MVTTHYLTTYFELLSTHFKLCTTHSKFLETHSKFFETHFKFTTNSEIFATHFEIFTTHSPQDPKCWQRKRNGYAAPPCSTCGQQLQERELGSFSNDDGDGNQDVKKAIDLLRKTTTLHVHHAFLYISLPSLHDYDVKMPDCKSYGGRKQATTNLFFSLLTCIRSSRNQLQGNSSTLTIFSKLE